MVFGECQQDSFYFVCLFFLQSKEKKSGKKQQRVQNIPMCTASLLELHKSRPLKSHCQKSVKGTRADVAANNQFVNFSIGEKRLVATILDRIKWNSKLRSPQIKDETAKRAKTSNFPFLILGEGRVWVFHLFCPRLQVTRL